MTVYVLASSQIKKDADFRVDFDLVLRNIGELNILAGEGISQIQPTKDGARLKVGQNFNFCYIPKIGAVRHCGTVVQHRTVAILIH